MKILLTTDGSDGSHHAIREAMRLLPLKDAQVTVLAVTAPPLVGMDPLVGYGLADGLTNTMQLERDVEATHAHLAEARRMLRDAGIQATELEREGDPAGTILETAKQLQADVIVLGSHGRNAVERLLLGSVSEAVLHRWHGAVLVVRPQP
ncbi:MAG: universal stress protein [Candidatus Sericytochromatia bacterium]